jgi:hypothetical protein
MPGGKPPPRGCDNEEGSGVSGDIAGAGLERKGSWAIVRPNSVKMREERAGVARDVTTLTMRVKLAKF